MTDEEFTDQWGALLAQSDMMQAPLIQSDAVATEDVCTGLMEPHEPREAWQAVLSNHGVWSDTKVVYGTPTPCCQECYQRVAETKLMFRSFYVEDRRL